MTVNTRPAIVSVPVRAKVLVLGATVKLAEPLPEPLPPVTVIQAVPFTTVHEQPADVVTAVDTLPPAAGTDWLAGEIENAHPAAACVTVNVCPATVSVPVRGLVVVLGAALKLAEPDPVPVAPLVSVNQVVLLLTPVHEHPAGAVTVVEPEPPEAATDALVGEIENVQPVVPALCVTVKTCVPMLTAPTREPPVFGCTV